MTCYLCKDRKKPFNTAEYSILFNQDNKGYTYGDVVGISITTLSQNEAVLDT